MATSAQRIHQLIEPTVSALGVELWGVEYLSQGRHSVLRVYIDREEGGVTLDDCERVSRQVSAILDVEDPIAGEYTLEVSSPGLDRPLFEAAHYLRFTGHEVRLQLRTPLEGRRRLKGVIRAVSDDVLSLEFEGETIEFPLTQIERARLSY